MTDITLQLEQLTCPSCMKKITDTVNDLKGVERTKVLFDSSKARVSYIEEKISERDIISKIEEIGYSAQKIQ